GQGDAGSLGNMKGSEGLLLAGLDMLHNDSRDGRRLGRAVRMQFLRIVDGIKAIIKRRQLGQWIRRCRWRNLFEWNGHTSTLFGGPAAATTERVGDRRAAPLGSPRGRLGNRPAR